MNIHNHAPSEQTSVKAFWRRPVGVAFLMAILIVAFFVLREHGGHIFGYWPYLILLACPLMHLMHGGHHHSSHQEQSTDENTKGVLK
ncbi:DUF2933 domain-containing protein [Zwartia sp.]|jgi:hypothetical protein|uniref:DUF2933 domain-containing protein n=1 Tax=Zwartia sp. TaxID=2978004 RepID=UPI003BAEAE38